MKKRRTRNVRLIKGRRSYTMSDLARIYGVHVRTVQSWHKTGMQPIDLTDRPLLFMGNEVRRYFSEKRQSKKFHLGEDEFRCMRCRAPRQAIPGSIWVKETGKLMGKDDELIVFKGICCQCGCKLNRLCSKRKAQTSVLWRMSKQAQERL